MATRSLFVQSQNLELVYLLPGAAVNLGNARTPQEGVGIDLRLVAPIPPVRIWSLTHAGMPCIGRW